MRDKLVKSQVGIFRAFVRNPARSIACSLLLGCFFVFIHDLAAHLKNKRPWLPTNDFLFALAVPVEGRSGIVASVPLSAEGNVMEVMHVRRGKYSIETWIPERLDDFTPFDPNIVLHCRFRDKHGREVFHADSDRRFPQLWTWCRGNRGGSEAVHCIYSAPKDVPLDDEMILRIDVSGNVDEFLRRYPGALLSVEKYTDK